MSDWLQWDYAQRLKPYFNRFKTTKEHINVDCPVCDEFHTSKHRGRKVRGYLLNRGSGVWYYCQRCGASMSFKSLLEAYFPDLYKEYNLERLKDRRKERPQPVAFAQSKPQSKLNDPLQWIHKISRLPEEHFARRYVEQRNIPKSRWIDLYFAPHFVRWTNQIVPDKLDSKEHGRLVIPFRNQFGQLHAYQGRSFIKDDPVKYLTIVIDENVPSIYGLDRVQYDRQILVFEGPIDSMFIDNAIASAGGDLTSKLSQFDKSLLTIVYDNERRSPTTIKKIRKAIEGGYNVVIWPEGLLPSDVNAMINSGLTAEQVQSIVKEHTYSGLKAHLALQRWSLV